MDKSFRVVLVDDDPDLRKLVKLTLEFTAGWEVEVAADGAARELLSGGWYFSSEVARILNGAAITVEEGVPVLREALSEARGEATPARGGRG